jgi:hypothetical protein
VVLLFTMLLTVTLSATMAALPKIGVVGGAGSAGQLPVETFGPVQIRRICPTPGHERPLADRASGERELNGGLIHALHDVSHIGGDAAGKVPSVALNPLMEIGDWTMVSVTG